MPDGVDHRHDHQPEGDRDADVPELVRLRVDHHRTRAREDEREGTQGFGDQAPGQRPSQR
jgi:hypothetical protein